AASRPNNPKCTRRLNIAALTNFSALIVYQSLWFNICFPLTAWITKLIFGLTLLAVGRLLFYLSNEESGDAGFFNCLKKGVVEFELDTVKEIDNAVYEIEKETNKAVMRILKEKYNDYEKDLLKLIKEGYEAADKMQVERKEVIKKIQEERVKAVDRVLKEIIRGKDDDFLPKTSKVEKVIDDRLKKEKDDADKEIKKEKDDALNEIKEKAGVEIDTEKLDVVSSDIFQIHDDGLTLALHTITKPQIPDSLRSTNMKSSTSEDSHADYSQIVETKDFSEDTVSKTDFITRRVAPEGSDLFSPKCKKKDKFFDDEKH
ncbi:14137_t:CDS:2, partial [Entrophospora sp. SA101]